MYFFVFLIYLSCSAHLIHEFLHLVIQSLFKTVLENQLSCKSIFELGIGPKQWMFSYINHLNRLEMDEQVQIINY